MKFKIDSNFYLSLEEFGNVYVGYIPCYLWQKLMPDGTIKKYRSPDWNLKLEDIMYDEYELSRFLQLLSNRIGKQVEVFDRTILPREKRVLLDYTGAFKTDNGTIVIMIRK